MRSNLQQMRNNPIGQMALHRDLGLRRDLPGVRSYIVAGARRTHQESLFTEEMFPTSYATDGSLLGNLRFALRYEPLDLGIINASLIAIGPDDLGQWVRESPTSIYSRKAWFLYETLTGDTLELPAARSGNYVDALNSEHQFVAAPIDSPRHRVRDNLLGTAQLCPTVRTTRRLESMIALQLDQEALKLTGQFSPDILARAASYLYTKETRSSFAIEGETPNRTREGRFLSALHTMNGFEPQSKEALISLQAAIVEPRYAAKDYRDFQNFVGETTRQFGEYVRFIGTRAKDVTDLMQGWMALTMKTLRPPLDPVIAAALIGFAFVFIHPFEDGNGRLHRFLIHYALQDRHYSPPNVIFPISVSILRQRHLYDAALEAFSKPALAATDWDFTEDHGVSVTNETRDLFRFFDATPQTEYLFDRIAETIREDFKEELEFIPIFDAAFAAVRHVVEMPDRRASLLVRLCLQNGGRLSNNKRNDFAELSDAEIAEIERKLEDILTSVTKSL